LLPVAGILKVSVQAGFKQGIVFHFGFLPMFVFLSGFCFSRLKIRGGGGVAQVRSKCLRPLLSYLSIRREHQPPPPPSPRALAREAFRRRSRSVTGGGFDK
jgi:hypothetical protein